MDDTQKMLRIVINGQSTMKQELSAKIDKLGKELKERIGGVEKNLAKRMDKLGRQLTYLEDDTPSREEFDGLEERVDKIEQKVAPTL